MEETEADERVRRSALPLLLAAAPAPANAPHPFLQMKKLLSHYQEAASEELRDLERQKFNIASAYRKSRTYKRVRVA